MAASRPRRRKPRAVVRRRGGQPSRTAHLLVLAAFAAGVIALWLVARRPEPEHRHGLSMAEARAANAAIPIAADRLASPRPYRFHGTPAAREQAIRCLATAALYEAGDDPEGQRAVMQVVLNRVARPGYPKTVCGVVYQGSGRPTGCQFSFTCDGSELRRPETQGWDEARRRARLALRGRTFAPVGTATHYHTDWVVPYWIGSLDKVAALGHHLFYQPKRSSPG